VLLGVAVGTGVFDGVGVWVGVGDGFEVGVGEAITLADGLAAATQLLALPVGTQVVSVVNRRLSISRPEEAPKSTTECCPAVKLGS
jgi:hypothetical protein